MHVFLTCSSVNVYFVFCFSCLASVAVYQLAHENKTVGIEPDQSTRIVSDDDENYRIWTPRQALLEAQNFTYLLLVLLITLLQQEAVQFPSF